jgi:hypothetical protein
MTAYGRKTYDYQNYYTPWSDEALYFSLEVNPALATVHFICGKKSLYRTKPINPPQLTNFYMKVYHATI